MDLAGYIQCMCIKKMLFGTLGQQFKSNAKVMELSRGRITFPATKMNVEILSKSLHLVFWDDGQKAATENLDEQ